MYSSQYTKLRYDVVYLYLYVFLFFITLAFDFTIYIIRASQTEELRWKVPAAKILKSKLPVQMPLLRIPIELLLSHYTDENGSLLVNVFLTQGPRNPASLGVLEEADSVDTNVSLEPIWTFNVPFKREMPLGSRTKRPACTYTVGLNARPLGVFKIKIYMIYKKICILLRCNYSYHT